jgi:hypothetical protein
VSATLSKKVENLGAKLMRDFVTVGFDSTDDQNEKDMAVSIP